MLNDNRIAKPELMYPENKVFKSTRPSGSGDLTQLSTGHSDSGFALATESSFHFLWEEYSPRSFPASKMVELVRMAATPSASSQLPPKESFMQIDRRILILPLLALSLSACKRGNPPAASTPAPQQQNAAATTATQPGAQQATPSSYPSQQAGQSNPAQQYSAQQTANKPSASVQGPPPPVTVNLPAGTRISVRTDRDLGSKISQTGDSFSASVAEDVRVNSQVVMARGARAEGTVIDAKPLGRFKGEARLAVRLERVQTPWGSYPVNTSSIGREEKGKGKRTAGFIGGGAGRRHRRRRQGSPDRCWRRSWSRHRRHRLHRQQADRSAGRNQTHLPAGKRRAHRRKEVERGPGNRE
jgi:hypothetical protein